MTEAKAPYYPSPELQDYCAKTIQVMEILEARMAAREEAIWKRIESGEPMTLTWRKIDVLKPVGEE